MKKQRKLSTFFLFISALFFSCPSAFSASGGWSSGGGGLATDEENPWFLGEAPISYCVTIASGFPLSKELVSREIQGAFSQWKNVFQTYGIYKKSLPGQFKDGIPRAVAVDATEIAYCDDPAHQLEFKIGVVDSDVSHHFETQSKDVIGLAQRQEYDHVTFRTGGFVWIAPDAWIDSQELKLPVSSFPVWEGKSTRLRSILLHEIGHVLGFPHLSGTVMDESLFSHLIYDHWYPSITMRPVAGLIETDSYSLNPFLKKSEVTFDDCEGDSELLLGSSKQQACQKLRVSFSSVDGIDQVTISSGTDPLANSAELMPDVGNWQNKPPYKSVHFYSPAYQPAHPGWNLKSEEILRLFDGDTVLKGAFKTARGMVPVEVRFNSTLTIEFFDPAKGWVQREIASPTF
jgi:hypothetical protein